jgi:hypothetical protein
MRVVDIGRMIALRRVPSVVVACLLGACNAEVQRVAAPASPGPVATVRIDLPAAIIEPFDAAPISALMRDAQGRPTGSVNDVSWTSSDTTIALVTGGMVRTHSRGDATITATVGRVSDSIVVHVAWRPETRLSIGSPILSLDVGVHFALSPSLSRSNGRTPLASGDVSWSSSNPLIAGIDAQGRVTAFTVGSTTAFARYQGLVDSMVVEVGLSKPGFGYFYSSDAVAEDYDETFWTPAPGKSFSTTGPVSVKWEVPYAGQPDFGWTGPGASARDAILHAVSLDNLLCAAYAQSDSGFQFVTSGAPLVECRDASFPPYRASVRMELLAFRAEEFTGTLAMVRPGWPALSTTAGGITQTASSADSRSYAVPGVSRDSLFWFVTAGADPVRGCWIAPSEATPSAAHVRITCDFFPFGNSDPLFYAVGFGADARRGSSPIGFVEVANGIVTRKVVSGLDIATTPTGARSTDVVISGAGLAAFDRVPAVLLTAVSLNSGACSITEPVRAAPTTVRLTVTCADRVAGFTLGVLY